MTISCNTSLQTINGSECIGAAFDIITANTQTIEDALNSQCTEINTVNTTLTLSSTDLQAQINDIYYKIVPVGGIVMFHLDDTSISTVSAGPYTDVNAITNTINTGVACFITSASAWQICNGATWHEGTGTTPDLRGKFVISTGTHETETFTYKTSAGEMTHTLTVNEMPQHRHSFNYTAPASGSSGRGGGYRSTSTTGAVGNTNNKGGDGAHNNVPQAVCLLFIQRIT